MWSKNRKKYLKEMKNRGEEAGAGQKMSDHGKYFLCSMNMRNIHIIIGICR